jgi:16S rRNA C967 or C1407 C5-methylase (RsmB/RsmF family)/NOL1/NOP2/fmu family ribosome biogenesis protein
MVKPERATNTSELELPEGFVERMEALLGAETPAFLAALSDPAQGLRVNTLRLAPEEFRRLSPFALAPLSYPPSGFIVGEEAHPGRHPYHAAGLYYLQDPGAMVVGELLGARPGERVLDLAAAPGGKSTHIAAMLRGEGVLVANDVHPTRARELAGNLERFGVTNALVTSESVERLADHFGAWFDRVLLDAPCSGESMFHKSEAARADWSPAAVQGCAARQEELLREAARLVRPGGLLLYSTCTFSPEEDEGALARFLDESAGWEVEALEAVPGAAPGRPEWVKGGERHPALARSLRLWPHRVPGAGHFVAGLRRGAPGEPGVADSAGPGPERRPPPPRAAVRLFEDFLAGSLRTEGLRGGALALVGSELYLRPDDLPDPGRLRVVRGGLWLGTVHRDRFEPSHSLAMALSAGEAADAVRLAPDDPAVDAYLRGEPIRGAGRKGWVLVTVDGFPLGWGKRVGDTIKNHYPKGLRRRGHGPARG